MVPLAFYIAAFILTISHLIEILIWGYVLSWSGLISNTHRAVIFAGSTYTTVGFGTNPLPLNWDLVMVVIALNGMVAFGWSISVLFGMTQVVTSARRESKSLTPQFKNIKSWDKDLPTLGMYKNCCLNLRPLSLIKPEVKAESLNSLLKKSLLGLYTPSIK